MAATTTTTTTTPPPSPSQTYVEWDEVQVSGDRGRRVVHYYLKDASGRSDLAVVGREKSIRHMSYEISRFFKDHVSVTSPSCGRRVPGRLKSRREVVDWLSSVVSDSLYHGSPNGAGRVVEDNDGVPAYISIPKGLSSRKMSYHSKDFLWLGSSWTCKKRRKHYSSFCRNGITISVHDFIHVMGEDSKRLVAYVEDLYEDLKAGNSVSVRWFHKVDEVGIALPPNTDDREIFFTLSLQDLSVECIDGLASVLSTKHFEKYLGDAVNTTWEPYLCRRKIDNDEIESFDITQVRGYWNQGFLRFMYTFSSKNVSKAKPRMICNLDETGTESIRQHRPRKKNGMHLSVGHVMANARDCAGKFTIPTKVTKASHTACLPGKEAFKQKTQQRLHPGCQIEVLCQDSGVRGCWFRCIILKRCKDKIKVQYKDVQDADGSGCLEEWCLITRVANSDTNGIRLEGRPMVRPHPSPINKVSCFRVGSVVDAWWHDGWWEGIVISRESEHIIHVYFPGEGQTSVFDQGELRHSLEWINNRWHLIGERPDLVTSLVADLEIEKHGEKREDGVCPHPFFSNKTLASDIGMTREEKVICSKLDPVVEDPEKENKEAFRDLFFKWGSSKKRCRPTTGKSSFISKRQCSNLENSNHDRDVEVCSVEFRIPLSESFTDTENCKLGGETIFNPPMPMSNLVMTR